MPPTQEHAEQALEALQPAVEGAGPAHLAPGPSMAAVGALAAGGGRNLRPEQVLAMQRSAGNAAVARMLATQGVARQPAPDGGDTLAAALAVPAPPPPASATLAPPEPAAEATEPVAEPAPPPAAEAVTAAAPEPTTVAPEADAATAAVPSPPPAPIGEGPAAEPAAADAAAAPAGGPPDEEEGGGPRVSVTGGSQAAPAPPTVPAAPAAEAAPDAAAAPVAADLPPELADTTVPPGPQLPPVPAPTLARRAAAAPAATTTAATQVVARDEKSDEEDSGILASIRRRISGVVGGLKSGWSSLSETASEAVDGVRERFTSVTEGLGSFADGVVTRVKDAWESVKETAGGLYDGLKKGLGSALGGLGGAVASIKSALVNMDVGALSGAWGALTGIVGGAWSGLQAGGTALKEKLGELWTGLQDGFTSGMSGLADRGKAMVDGLKSMASGVTGRLGSLWDGLVDKASGLTDEGGGVVKRALASAIRSIVGAGETVWGGIKTGWSGLKQRAGGWLSGVGESAQGIWDGLKQRASGAWDGIKGAWSGVKSAASDAADTLTGGIRTIWNKISGFSLGGVIEKLGKYVPAMKTIQEAADDPEAALEPYTGGISEQLTGVPDKAQGIMAEHGGGGGGGGENGAAQTSATPASASAVPAGPVLARMPVSRARSRGIQRQEERDTATWAQIWDGLCLAVVEKWNKIKVKELVKEMLLTLIWPWPTVGKELKLMVEEWGNAVDSFYAPRSPLEDPLGCLHDLYSNLLKVLDFPIVLWRHLMNIGLALMGWITIFLMIAGAIGGAVGGTVVGAVAGAVAGLGIGAAPGAAGGGAAGGVAGAGAGFGAAMGLGEALVIGYAGGEVVAIGKSLLELKTGRQTPEEQVRDYNQVADSGIGLAIIAILVALAWIAGRLAGMVASRLAKVVPDWLKVAAEEFAEGAKKGRPSKEGEPPTDTAAADEAKKAYDDLNPSTAPKGYTFTDTVEPHPGGGKVVTTEVTAPDGSTGHVTRSFDPATGKVEMLEAFLDRIPKDKRIIEIDGKTMPLVDYLTLRQLKLLDVPFGTVLKVKMSTIQNVRTIAHVAAQERAGVPPADSISASHSVSYAERSIGGSGHRVKSVKIEPGSGTRSPFRDMLEHYERRNPSLKDGAHKKILEEFGIGRDDVVFWNFDIIIELEPLPTSGAAPTGATGPTSVVGPPTPSEEQEKPPVEVQ
jgi:hypothetical protein